MVMNEFEAQAADAAALGFDVRTFPIWMDIDDPLGLRAAATLIERPHEFPVATAFRCADTALRDAGVDGRGPIGVDLAMIQRSSWDALVAACPDREFQDATDLFYAVRAIKTGWEIERLAEAVRLAEDVIMAVVEHLGPGTTEADLAAAFKHRLAEVPLCLGPRLTMVSVGDQFSPTHLPRRIPARPGDLVKFDVGADIEGYGSDIARSFVVGEASDVVRRLFGALRAGHDHLLAMAGPGVPMRAIFEAGMQTMRTQGIPRHNRGHLGHTVGLDVKIEEPPSIGPGEKAVLQPGMVVCLETPCCAYGVGSLSIEDMVIVTDSGSRRLNRLDRDLVRRG